MSDWWEPRQPGERTTAYLGRVLEEAGLGEMALRARLGHFDDYFCPPDVDDGMNMNRLINELRQQSGRLVMAPQRKERVDAIRAAVIKGEFDGTESDEWAASAQGQETMRAFNALPRYG